MINYFGLILAFAVQYKKNPGFGYADHDYIALQSDVHGRLAGIILFVGVGIRYAREIKLIIASRTFWRSIYSR
ncbi:MAG: hypothetical protein ACI9C4_001385 [Paraglaciecola sp.]|jgi:hypothetical protein